MATSDPSGLYSKRSEGYVRLIRSVRYADGIRSYFQRSPHLGSHLRVLDAGCGTGVVTLALREALVSRGLVPGAFDAFDLTPAMLGRFLDTLRERGIQDVELAQADVLELQQLPSSWSAYDLIVSASMLEYIPPRQLVTALSGLRSLLRTDGRLVLFITRRNWLTRPLVGWWWRANLYKRGEIERALREAGFSHVDFARFPSAFRHLGLWGHIVEGRR